MYSSDGKWQKKTKYNEINWLDFRWTVSQTLIALSIMNGIVHFKTENWHSLHFLISNKIKGIKCSQCLPSAYPLHKSSSFRISLTSKLSPGKTRQKLKTGTAHVLEQWTPLTSHWNVKWRYGLLIYFCAQHKQASFEFFATRHFWQILLLIYKMEIKLETLEKR